MLVVQVSDAVELRIARMHHWYSTNIVGVVVADAAAPVGLQQRTFCSIHVYEVEQGRLPWVY